MTTKLNRPDYTLYVVYSDKYETEINSGWDNKRDAEEYASSPHFGGKAKVYTRRGLTQLGLNPDDDNDWGGLHRYRKAKVHGAQTPENITVITTE